MVASTDTKAAFDEHLASTVVGSVEGESATSRHKKSTATVVIDLDAWLRAIPASICALLVAGERAPIRPERSQKFIAAQRFAVSGAKVGSSRKSLAWGAAGRCEPHPDHQGDGADNCGSKFPCAPSNPRGRNEIGPCAFEPSMRSMWLTENPNHSHPEKSEPEQHQARARYKPLPGAYSNS